MAGKSWDQYFQDAEELYDRAAKSLERQGKYEEIKSCAALSNAALALAQFKLSHENKFASCSGCASSSLILAEDGTILAHRRQGREFCLGSGNPPGPLV